MNENLAPKTNPLLRQIIIIIVILSISVLVFMRLGIFTTRSVNSHSITYRLEGSASTAQVSYTLANGVTSELIAVTVPWHITLKIPKGTVVILTAGNPTQTGDLGCELLLDGKEWKRAFAKSPEDKISCAGIVP